MTPAEKRLRGLGYAWMGLGFVELAWAAFCVFGGLVLGVMGFGDADFAAMMFVLSGAYGVLFVAAGILGALHVYAGVKMRSAPTMTWVLGAIASALPSLLLALYCTPITLMVLFYTVIVMLDDDVRARLQED